MLYFFIYIFKALFLSLSPPTPLCLTHAMELSHVSRLLLDALISLYLLSLFLLHLLLLHPRLLIIYNRPLPLPPPVFFSFCEFLFFSFLAHVPLFSPTKHLGHC